MQKAFSSNIIKQPQGGVGALIGSDISLSWKLVNCCCSALLSAQQEGFRRLPKYLNVWLKGKFKKKRSNLCSERANWVIVALWTCLIHSDKVVFILTTKWLKVTELKARKPSLSANQCEKIIEIEDIDVAVNVFGPSLLHERLVWGLRAGFRLDLKG